MYTENILLLLHCLPTVPVFTHSCIIVSSNSSSDIFDRCVLVSSGLIAADPHLNVLNGGRVEGHMKPGASVKGTGGGATCTLSVTVGAQCVGFTHVKVSHSLPSRVSAGKILVPFLES